MAPKTTSSVKSSYCSIFGRCPNLRESSSASGCSLKTSRSSWKSASPGFSMSSQRKTPSRSRDSTPLGSTLGSTVPLASIRWLAKLGRAYCDGRTSSSGRTVFARALELRDATLDPSDLPLCAHPTPAERPRYCELPVELLKLAAGVVELGVGWRVHRCLAFLVRRLVTQAGENVGAVSGK